MITIKAFRGIRPLPEYAARVASRPYDVMNRQEAKQEAAGNPLSFLHVIRPEIDLPDSIDEHDPRVYQKAKENFQSLLAQGIFKQESADCFYVYELTMHNRSQTGLVACSSVDDYFADKIKKHEHTRPVKEQDRIDHMLITGIHAEPVFLTFRDVDAVTYILFQIKDQSPDYDFISSDNIKHRFWVMRDPSAISQLTQIFKTHVPATYIADGHHRAASSAKVGRLLAEQNPHHSGKEEYNFFLTVLFPASQLHIMDYNRLVADLNGLTEAEFLQKVAEKFQVHQRNDSFRPSGMHEFGMYLGGKWYKLLPHPGTFAENDPIGSLDVSILQDNLLRPILGITDPRTDKRIDFSGGIRGLQELERRVNQGEMQVAFALYPVSMEQLLRIADMGQVMPPKSTWFEPKLRSGLIIHPF